MKKPDMHEIALRLREKGLSSDRHNIEDIITERILEAFNDELSAWVSEVKEELEGMEQEGEKLTKEEYFEKYSD